MQMRSSEVHALSFGDRNYFLIAKPHKNQVLFYEKKNKQKNKNHFPVLIALASWVLLFQKLRV